MTSRSLICSCRHCLSGKACSDVTIQIRQLLPETSTNPGYEVIYKQICYDQFYCVTHEYVSNFLLRHLRYTRTQLYLRNLHARNLIISLFVANNIKLPNLVIDCKVKITKRFKVLSRYNEQLELETKDRKELCFGASRS